MVYARNRVVFDNRRRQSSSKKSQVKPKRRRVTPRVTRVTATRAPPANTMDASDAFSHVKLTIWCSLTAWPISQSFNYCAALIDQNVRPFWMMAIAFVILSLIGLVAHLAGKVKDWLFTGIVIFSFSAMVDLIICLEFKGVVVGFMDQYLKYGEPYLSCTWGMGIMLFAAIGFQIMYLLMVYFLTNGKSWRSVGIYWGAGILHSMIVLLIGALVGQAHAPTFCIFLNVPFVVFPIIVLIRVFNREPRCNWTRATKTSLDSFLQSLLLAVLFLATIWITMAKGLAAFGCKGWPVLQIVVREPALFLADPAPFAKIQAIVFLLYLVPAQCTCLFFLFRKEVPHFMWEVGVAQAGILVQGQFSHLYMCLCTDTPPQFQSNWRVGGLWVANLLVVIVPHLYLIHLRWTHRRRQQQQQKQRKGKKPK